MLDEDNEGKLGPLDPSDAFRSTSPMFGAMLCPGVIIEKEQEMGRTSYAEFLKKKLQVHHGDGFAPLYMPDFLFPFQQYLTEWAIKMGRALIAADCGLGKTACELVWARNVLQKTGKPVLIMTPLAVSHQTQREGEKFGIECIRSSNGSIPAGIVTTNYERLHKFHTEDFGGVVCDESSILKNFSGSRRREITQFMKPHRYRLLCTATAAPNDYYELGTSSEALGYLGYTDMLTKFFKEESKKDHLGWGRKTYRFRGHAEIPFWRWGSGWIRACRKPSDFGFEDGDFILPALNQREILIQDATPRPGMLFSAPAMNLKEQREERRITLNDRCQEAAKVAMEHPSSSVLWCHLNEEARRLVALIPDAKEVSGSMSDEQKEARLLAFQDGQIRILVTKPKIGCFGLNWQHCHNVVMFPSHSWEQYYQAVRRCWRFGQHSPVQVAIVTTPGEQRVLANLNRKAKQADAMFTAIVAHMNESIQLGSEWVFDQQEKMPAWLGT